MKKSHIFGTTAAVTAVLVAGASTAAFAAWEAATFESFSYGDVIGSAGVDDFYLGDTAPTSAWFTAHPQDETDNANWDGHGKFAVYNPVTDEDIRYNGFDPTTCEEDRSGADYLLRCSAEELIPGVFVHPEVRFFAADNSQRILWVLENRTSAAIDILALEFAGSECDGDSFGEVSEGWSGENFTGEDITDSNWLVQREEDNGYDECGIEANAWQSTDAVVAAGEESGLLADLNEQSHAFEWSLPAGETHALAFFYADFWIDDEDSEFEETVGNPYFDSRAAQFASATAYADVNWGTWSDSLALGLDGTIDIPNWNYDAPELADTGVDASGVALAGAMLAAAGTAIVVRRRVRA
jgi:hypothetical protein